jgi:hypothetical protein
MLCSGSCLMQCLPHLFEKIGLCEECR